MSKQNIVNSETPGINLNSILVVFGVIIAIATAGAIYMLNSNISSNNNQLTNEPERVFDQATINTINSLSGSSSELPTTRNNPF